jgi:exosortase
MTLVRRHVAFCIACGLVTLGHWSVARALFDYSQLEMSASHLVFIPLVTAGLVFQSRSAIFSRVSSDWIVGAPVMALGLALSVGAAVQPIAPDTWLQLSVLGLVVAWIGLFALVYGRAAARAAQFPLLFLVFTVPIPAVLLEGTIAFLKRGSAEAVAGLFAMTGTPFHRQGFVFSLPTIAIEIADECSGIRSSIALLLTSLLAGDAFLRSPWRKALLVLAIVPVTIFKNAVRIVGLSLLSIHVNPSFLTGQLHHDGGIVFFLMALAILAPVLAILRRGEVDRPRRPVTPAPAAEIQAS